MISDRTHTDLSGRGIKARRRTRSKYATNGALTTEATATNDKGIDRRLTPFMPASSPRRLDVSSTTRSNPISTLSKPSTFRGRSSPTG